MKEDIMQHLQTVADVQEQETEWVIPCLIPKGGIQKVKRVEKPEIGHFTTSPSTIRVKWVSDTLENRQK